MPRTQGSPQNGEITNITDREVMDTVFQPQAIDAPVGALRGCLERYSRMHGSNVQDALFFCDTPDEAKAKYRELLDVLLHHDGIYLGSKAKRKVRASSRKPAK
jgi:hypothetical protein